MPTWQQQMANVNAAIVDPRAFGVPVTYSRNISANFAAIAPFALNVSIETGREYADPLGPEYGEVGVRNIDLPLGGQKGDLILLADSTPTLSTGTYEVQQVWNDNVSGWSRLLIRWTGQ